MVQAVQFCIQNTAQTIDARSLAVYNEAVRNNFQFLKQISTLDKAQAVSLPLPRVGGYLLPICELHLDDAMLISTLSNWRRENAFAYPSRFPVTDEGTLSWLSDRLLKVPDRLLFLVLDKHGYPVGHLGYANCLNDRREMEIDNVVRGVNTAARGIMTEAMEVLLHWAEETIGPCTFHLRVFDDNAHAVNFYRALGFKDTGTIPLRKSIQGEVTTFSPMDAADTTAADKIFLRMEYSPRREAGDHLILTAGPSMSGKELWYVLDAARTGWNNKWGDYIRDFEQAFAQYVGAKYALSTSSCTGALHLALLALGIGPGDEVIVPEITWVATANAVAYVGATPVFADIEADSWCMDPTSFESLITPRTKAVMPVHLYGHPARMDRIMEIAHKHGLRVLEDAAPAIGAECFGRRTGTFGDFAAFSFQGAKLLVTGEGGMLVTSDDNLYQKARVIWDQGRRPGTFWIEQTGYKYKMSNIQAALGLGQIERVEQLIEAKRRIFEWYAEGLGDVAGIRLNYETEWARSIFWMSSIYLDNSVPISRDEMRSRLRARNVDTRPVFPAVSQYPIWPLVQAPQPIADDVGKRAINLPSGVCLKRHEVDYICRSIQAILA
jgi:perosamine synthetase